MTLRSTSASSTDIAGVTLLKSTAKAIRELLDGQRVLSLAVVADGLPYAGLLPFVPLPGYADVLIHASRMSRHSQGLASGGRVGVLVHEQDSADKDPLQLKRVTFECSVQALERKGDAWNEGRARYLERFPGSRITFNLGDFTLYRLEFQRGLYVGGFGRAVEIAPDDIGRIK
jgi:putative heme iron utilization protein